MRHFRPQGLTLPFTRNFRLDKKLRVVAACTPPKRKPSPRRLAEPVEEPRGVPAEVGEVPGLEWILVQTAEP
ncbi:MAG: hypothetical protein ACRERU_09535, partial [Methylococcales bacterium]